MRRQESPKPRGCCGFTSKVAKSLLLEHRHFRIVAIAYKVRVDYMADYYRLLSSLARVTSILFRILVYYTGIRRQPNELILAALNFESREWSKTTCRILPALEVHNHFELITLHYCF
jgi:hypothetical protein